MKLFAISDLHATSASNREALAELAPHPGDWLIVAGDLAERPQDIDDVFAILVERFARVIWAPGNHDLWRVSDAPDAGGEAKYSDLVARARRHGVLTPEDPYAIWPGEGGPCVIAPLLLLYDYSFRPADVPLEQVVAWANESNSACADESFLDPFPFATLADWCVDRCCRTARRLEIAGADLPKILVNHFPLRRDLVWIPRIPRFAPWCGTTLTEDWHIRFAAKVVVSGHLHVRRTDWRDGVRFEEVSLGYPGQWDRRRGVAAYLRQILPGA